MTNKLKVVLSTLASAAIVVFATGVFAASTPPSFPTCTYDRESGDIHYEEGLHQIVGGDLLSGTDDVYFLGDGNALQCFCPEEGNGGTQTIWWKIGDLSQEEIDGFISDGWFLENGLVWNLDDANYLAKNSNFSCSATPTPTPTTPPGPPGPPPVCEATDLGGWAPTITEIKRVSADTVHACWTASTPNADDYIVYYGMSKDNLPWNTKVENSQCVDIHGLPAGQVWIKVAATDNCIVGPFSTIVEQTPQVLGASTAKELPSTGTTALFLLGFTPLGYYLYKRFTLV